MRLVIVTGLSGSGKSIALDALEDQGYYCIDNMPMFLLLAFAQDLIDNRDPHYEYTAVGVDARTHHEDPEVIETLVTKLRKAGIDCKIAFLEAEEDILIRRFSETRRPHPLSKGDKGLAAAIHTERELLAPLLDAADLRIDTSHTNLHQLRDIVRHRVAESEGNSLSLQIQSFGFKHGIPRDADFVFDARCLPNPHWQQNLRAHTGRDAPVAEFLKQQPDVMRMRQRILEFIEEWIPCFEADGRSYLTVAIGCTGGQHRSVFLSEQLAAAFADAQRQVLLIHRELG